MQRRNNKYVYAIRVKLYKVGHREVYREPWVKLEVKLIITKWQSHRFIIVLYSWS